VDLDEAKQAVLDEVLQTYANEMAPNADDQKAEVTLRYTHNLHRSWRTALRMLPIDPAWSILDVGCGLGILSFELAANLPLVIQGIDIEESFIVHADQLLARLDDRGIFHEGARVRFTPGDIHDLPVPDNTVDLLFVRELLQFLPDPVSAVRELFRVVKPGGYACISDTDDQLYITWPPPCEAQTRLVDAFTSLHRGKGGDRQTGRKLSTYLGEAGFEVVSTVVLPEAQHRMVDANDVERALIIGQLRAARDRMIAFGSITPEDFERYMTDLESEPARPEFRLNARIIAMGRKLRAS
jgi:ubiquinone/menaquinone biosynthesis C-methylase UbiE